MTEMFRFKRWAFLLLVFLISASATAQQKSVRPGINDSFRDPDPGQFTERFEIESREVFAKRKDIVSAMGIKPSDVIADIGAGTGLFTRQFAATVGPEGRVIVIDFRRIDGESSEWTLSHVRAGQEVFESEILQAGFEKIDEVHDLLKENYMVVFTKSKPELFPMIQ